MEGRRYSSVAAGAAIIFAGTLTSRIIGLVRDNLLNNVFHSNLVKDAFASAFLVPDTLYNLLAGGALSAAFIPVFSSYLVKGEKQEANRIAGAIATLLMLTIIVGLVLVFIFAPQLVHVVAVGYAEGTPKFNLTVILAREMCAMVLFTALSALLTGMLQSINHFLAPVIVWNTYSLGIILGIQVFSRLPVPAWTPAFLHWHGPILGIHGAALGVLAGAVSLVVIQLPVVLKHGFRLSPIFDLRHEGVRHVLRLFAPVTVGLAISQINLFTVPQSLGSLVGDGGVMAIRNATRLVLLPLGLFGLAISNAAFPRLSQQINQGERAAYLQAVNKALRMLLLFMLPSALLIFVLAYPVIALIIGGENCGLTQINAAAFTLSYFTLGIFAISLVQFANRAFYALQDTLTPVIVQVVAAVVNIGLAVYLVKYTLLSYGGVALATSVCLVISALAMLEILRRRLGGIGGWSIAASGLKILVASLLMCAAAYFTARALAPQGLSGGRAVTLLPAVTFSTHAPSLARLDPGGLTTMPGQTSLRLHLLIQLAAAGFAGLLVYAAALWALRSAEFMELIRRIGGKYWRGRTV